MRLTRALLTLSLAACSSNAFAQDDRLPVLRPTVETVKASPTPFPFADKSASDFDTWIRTPWVQMNRAKCGDSCILVSLTTSSGGLMKVDTAGAKKGIAKLRLGVVIPPACGESAW
jgi:hypothetical protein